LIPEHIVDLYIYFLYTGKKSNEAFERFYDADNSRVWVRRYAVKGKEFYAKFMSMYLKEIREREGIPFSGVMTPRGVLKC